MYKEHSVVSLVGIEGKIGEVKAYYSYPEAITESSKVVIIEAEGKTPREARMNADTKVEQALDVSMMSALLIGVTPAEEGLLEFLDIYYREPMNSISTLMILVEGDVKQYLEASQSWSAEAGEFYTRLIESNEVNAIVPRYTVQTAGALLYAKGLDLILPYVKMDEEKKRPIIGGVALFKEDRFTGGIIELEQSVYLGLLNPRNSGHPSLSYLYNEKPVSITVVKKKDNWHIKSSNSIKLSYDLTVEIDEYSDGGLRDVKKVNDIEDFLSKEIKGKMEEVLSILQEEKSDGIGIGRFVRENDSKLFDEKNWHEKFSKLDIEVEVKTNVVKVGIIQ